MLKRLVILGLATFLLGWPSISHEQQVLAHQRDGSGKTTTKTVPPTRVVIEQSPAIDQLKPIPDKSQTQTPEKPLPLFLRSEWVIVYITGIYVIISGWTLIAIKRQANLMKEQSDLAKSKERARLRVEMGAVVLGVKPDFLGFGANWTVNIYGPTEAFIVASQCHCWVGHKSRYMSPPNPDPTGLPDVISPGSKPLPMFVSLHNSDNSDNVSVEERLAVEGGRMVIYCTGLIIFKNVFDETWMLDFAQRYEVTLFAEGETFGMWSRNEKGDNRERQLFPVSRRWFGLRSPVPPS